MQDRMKRKGSGATSLLITGMKKMNFTTVEELLVNDGFLKWYQKTDEKEVQLWEEWISENPEHQQLANEAIQILLLFQRAQESKIAELDIEEATTRLTLFLQKTRKT
jgi:hypothetical protein